MMPHLFHHHQIDLAQRDGLKINLSQITSESFLLLLIADYAENYTHLAQVILTIVYMPIIWFFPIFLNIHTYISCFVVDESNAMVSQTFFNHSNYSGALLGFWVETSSLCCSSLHLRWLEQVEWTDDSLLWFRQVHISLHKFCAHLCHSLHFHYFAHFTFRNFYDKKMAGPCLLNQETSICTLSLIMREISARMYTSSVGW